MSNNDLLYEVKDNIAYFIINREEKRNALNANIMNSFIDYFDKAEKDNEIRVVCITGAGDKAFCSGADLASGSSSPLDKGVDGPNTFVTLMKKMSKFPKPIVGKINGFCLAGGTGLMLSCDIVVAHEEVKFGTPEVNVGLFPMMIGVLILRDVRRKKAMQMVLSGEKLSAAEAERIGLISEVVSKEKFEGRVNEILKNLAKRSPIGIKLGKEAFNNISTMNFEDSLKHLGEALVKVTTTDDAKEGITAFFEKREPKFTGK